MNIRYRRLEILSRQTNEVEHTIEFEPSRSERMAEKVQDGVNRNLDHERFYTKLVRVEGR